MRVSAAALALALATATPGDAAPAGTDASRVAVIPLPPIAPRSPEAALPPYQDRLDRLAELMGTLSFLRDLCGKGDGAVWHSRMETLLSAEGTTDARRDRLAGSFNRGYTGYQPTYRTCTPAAETVIDRALREGSRIASDVAARFGTP